MNILELLLSVLACWRVCHMIVFEDGPWCWFVKLREANSENEFGYLLGCHKCLSVWVSIPPALYFSGIRWETIFYWLAISAARILIQRVYDARVL